MRASLRTTTAAIAASALALAGCGGGASGTRADTASLERATRTLGERLVGGEGDTYEFLSAACREEIPEAEWEASMQLVMGLLRAFVGDDVSVRAVETRDVRDGEGEARFLLDVPEPDDPDVRVEDDSEWLPWRFEDGAWRVADCDALTEGSGGTDGGGADGDPFAVDLGELDFDGAESTVTIDREAMFSTPSEGEATLTLLEVAEVESPVEDGAGGRHRARGRFVGARYRVDNGTDGDLKLFFDVVTQLDATDGETAFAIEDGAASDAVSAAREGDAANDDVPPGGSGTAWVVYDVPEDAEIVGFVYRPDSFGFEDPVAVGLP